MVVVSLSSCFLKPVVIDVDRFSARFQPRISPLPSSPFFVHSACRWVHALFRWVPYPSFGTSVYISSSLAVVLCPRPSSLSVSLFYVLVSRSFLGSFMSYVLVLRLRSFSALSGLNFSKHNIELTNSIQAYCDADYAADRDRKSIPDTFSSMQAKLLVDERRSKGLLNRGLKENMRPWCMQQRNLFGFSTSYETSGMRRIQQITRKHNTSMSNSTLSGIISTRERSILHIVRLKICLQISWQRAWKGPTHEIVRIDGGWTVQINNYAITGWGYYQICRGSWHGVTEWECRLTVSPCRELCKMNYEIWIIPYGISDLEYPNMPNEGALVKDGASHFG